MVLLIKLSRHEKWLAIIGKINPTFSDKPTCCTDDTNKMRSSVSLADLLPHDVLPFWVTKLLYTKNPLVGRILPHYNCNMGLSENVVYPYTQWLMIIIPTKWL